MSVETRHDIENTRFVISLEGATATLEYTQASEGTLDFTSTFVPVEHRNKRIGERLVIDAFDYVRAKGYRVIPSCPFVRTIARRHSEYQDLLTER